MALAAVASAACAVAFALLNDAMPEAAPAWLHAAPNSVLLCACLIGILAYPVLILLGFRHLGTGGLPAVALGLELHFAAYLICLSFLLVWEAPYGPDMLLHVVAIVLEVRLILAIRQAGGMPWPRLAPYVGLAVCGGLWAGLILWSDRMAPRIAAAANARAEGRPYCILTAGRRVARLRDLTALAIYERIFDGTRWNFYALLIVGDPGTQQYFNWSFKRGSFQPVTPHALNALGITRSRDQGYDPCRIPARGGESAPPV